MSLLLVLDGRAQSRQFMTGLARQAGHRAIAAADAALAADLVREHASDLWLIAANADDPDTAALQKWLRDASIRRVRPCCCTTRMVLASRSSSPSGSRARSGTRSATTSPRRAGEKREALERELADTLRALKTVEAEREQLMVRLVGAEEAERERIAADIHDDSLQVMASAVLRLGMLAASFPSRVSGTSGIASRSGDRGRDRAPTPPSCSSSIYRRSAAARLGGAPRPHA